MQLKGMSVMCDSVPLLLAEDSFPLSTAAELYGKYKANISLLLPPPFQVFGKFSVHWPI